MSHQPAPISVQLYSLREEAAVDFVAVLAQLGSVGFVGVELAGLHGMSPAQFAKTAADAGLVVSSGHVGDPAPDALNRALDDLQGVGCNTAALAFLPPTAFADADAIAQSAEILNSAQTIAASRGVRLGYHNHWWEFAAMDDGRTAMAYFLDLLDASVFVELDTYWTRVGGADPAHVLTELGARARLIHVKDGPADDPKNPMVAVGSGSMDIAAVIAAAGSAEWHIVELDRCANDMATAISDSYRFLVGSGLSRGRT